MKNGHIVSRNHANYLERIRLYKRFGYDIEKNRKYILDVSQPLYGKILEIGTGKGHMTVALARKGYNLVSVDISKEDQETARLNLQYYGVEDRVSLRIENAENPSFPDRSFDIIISVNTVHHIENPLKALDEMIRMADLKGKIVVSEFTEKGLTIINKVHDSEGRTHDNSASKIKLNDIAEYLNHKKQFTVINETNGFQRVLVISRRFC